MLQTNSVGRRSALLLHFSQQLMIAVYSGTTSDSVASNLPGIANLMFMCQSRDGAIKVAVE
jgi:hypothetical protein